MRIAMLQTDPAWEKPEVNFSQAEEMIDRADAELVILPEMFKTGFSMNAEFTSVAMEDPQVAWLTEKARQTGKSIMTSLPIKEDIGGKVKYYNRFMFASPDGVLQTYDKRHLFRGADEHEVFTGGSQQKVFELDGFRIRPVICYDIRFPVWCRNKGDYDILVAVASWPDARINAWLALLRARAIENQAYVIGVNRCGESPEGIFSGKSTVFDYKGEVIAQARDHTPDIVTVELEKESLVRFREEFPAWLDADDFVINV